MYGYNTNHHAHQTVSNIIKKRKSNPFENSDINVDIPESKLYQELLHMEKAIDHIYTQRKREILSYSKNSMSPQSLQFKIVFYNTYSNQTNDDKSDIDDEPKWTFRIEGSCDTQTKKFSSFLKKIVIQLDEEEYKEEAFLEWNMSSLAPSDGFEVTRRGNKDTLVKVVLFPDYNPPLFYASEDLFRILELKRRLTHRSHVILAAWKYIDSKKLIDIQTKKIICDKEFKELFNCNSIDVGDLVKHLNMHLNPPEPLEFLHLVKVSGSPKENLSAYTFNLFHVEDREIPMFQETDKQIKEIEKNIQELSSKISDKRKKRDFLKAFCIDPAGFVDEYVHTHIQDKELLRNLKNERMDDRKSEFYNHPNVNTGVDKYFKKSDMDK